ncbi:MAG: hypothetical protein AAGF95_22515 [Chloroflexota bacterium]
MENISSSQPHPVSASSINNLPNVRWYVPPLRAGLAGQWDGFIGPGATRAETWLILGASIFGAVLPLLYAVSYNPGWSILQLIVAVCIGLDLWGGVVAHATSTTKRWYHRPGQSFIQHFLFVCAHVLHIALLAWLFRALDWYFVGVIGGYLLITTLLILKAPLYLRRPLALLVCCGALIVNSYVVAPTPGLEWFVPVLFLKLIIGHIVPEEPYLPME